MTHLKSWKNQNNFRNEVINIKKCFKKISSKLRKKVIVSDGLVILSFFIIFFTTFKLNKYIAMYLLAAFLLLMSFILSKGGD